MEQIVRSGESLFYGDYECVDADDAYRRFRECYTKELGKISSKRLNKLGRRVAVVSSDGFVFADNNRKGCSFDTGICKIYLLGLLCGSYCKILGCWDMPDNVTDDNYEEWYDWAFSHGSGALRTIKKKGGIVIPKYKNS